MQRTIIVTDLTRFSKKQTVCTAGIDPQTGQCIRPMPYIQSSVCERLKILPGAKLSADFTPVANLTGPHREDCRYDKLMFSGPCTSDEFKSVLEQTCVPSIDAGFEIALPAGQKFLPANHPVQRSIITLQVSPNHLEIVEDAYTPGKIKIHFQDGSGCTFRYIGITDLGFHDYALEHHNRNELEDVNNFIRSQETAFLRIGLSRAFKAPDGREGFWLQANGIYTFPAFHETIRSYPVRPTTS